MAPERLKGAYILLFRLERDQEVTVGRLGAATFPKGRYAYAGSALGGLEARVRRHLDGGGKKHWHIDHLVELAEEKEAVLFPSEADRECELNAMVAGLPGSRVILKGFGSSDCRCTSHLHLLSDAGASFLMTLPGPRMRPSRTFPEEEASAVPAAPFAPF